MNKTKHNQEITWNQDMEKLEKIMIDYMQDSSLNLCSKANFLENNIGKSHNQSMHSGINF